VVNDQLNCMFCYNRVSLYVGSSQYNPNDKEPIKQHARNPINVPKIDEVYFVSKNMQKVIFKLNMGIPRKDKGNMAKTVAWVWICLLRKEHIFSTNSLS